VWLAGAAVLACWGIVSFLRVRREVAASIPVSENVMACDELPSPFILGIFRPVIYVPSYLNGADLDYVLTHERAHLRRHDHWWKPLGYLLLCVYWFNPLCWLAYVLLCRDIESACDERVIRDMNRAGMAAYSQTLLNCSMPAKRISVCPLAFGETGVKERVKNVLNYRKPAFWVIAAALAACIVVAVCFLTDPSKGISTRELEKMDPELKAALEDCDAMVRVYLYKVFPVSADAAKNNRTDSTFGISYNPCGDGLLLVFELQEDFFGNLSRCRKNMVPNYHLYIQVYLPPEQVVGQNPITENILPRYADGNEEPPEDYYDGWNYGYWKEWAENTSIVKEAFLCLKLWEAGSETEDGIRYAVYTPKMLHLPTATGSKEGMKLTSTLREYAKSFSKPDIAYGIAYGMLNPEDKAQRVWFNTEEAGTVSGIKPSAAPKTTPPAETDIVDRAAENTLPDGWRELTQEEIQTAADAFLPLYSSESADGLVNCCFTSHYADPRDLNLREFLRYCPSSESANEEEYRALVVTGQLYTGSRWKTLSEMPTPLHRYPAAEVDAVLRKFYGIGLDDLNVDYREMLMYLPESAAFFNVTSDWGGGTFTPTHGETDGQIVILRNEYVTLTLEKDGDNWLIRSFLYADGTADNFVPTEVEGRENHSCYRFAEYEYVLSTADLTLYDEVNGAECGSVDMGTRLSLLSEACTASGELWLQVLPPTMKSSDQSPAWIPLDNVRVWTEELAGETRSPWYLPAGSSYWFADSKNSEHSPESTVYPENERSTKYNMTCSVGQREGDYTYVYASGRSEMWVLTKDLQISVSEDPLPETECIREARQRAQAAAPAEEWGAELVHLYQDGAEEIHVYFPVQGSGDYVCVRYSQEMEYLATDYIPESQVPPYYEEG